MLIPDLKWHSEVRSGGLITKDHDEHMFKLLTGLALRPYTEPRGFSVEENVPGDSVESDSGTELYEPFVDVADWGMPCGDC
jgi:hypothetical protein